MIAKILRLELMSGKAKDTGNQYTICTGVFGIEVDPDDASVTTPTYTRTKLGYEVGKYSIDENTYPHIEKQFLKKPDAVLDLELKRRFNEKGVEVSRIAGFKEVTAAS